MKLDLPHWLYNSLPYFYLIAGILFIVGSWYVTFQDKLAPLYVGMGGFSLGLAFVVHSCRRKGKQCQEGDPCTDAQDEKKT